MRHVALIGRQPDSLRAPPNRLKHLQPEYCSPVYASALHRLSIIFSSRGACSSWVPGAHQVIAHYPSRSSRSQYYTYCIRQFILPTVRTRPIFFVRFVLALCHDHPQCHEIKHEARDFPNRGISRIAFRKPTRAVGCHRFPPFAGHRSLCFVATNCRVW